MSIEFHNTIMGRRFIEGTVPALVTQLERLNTNLEKLEKLTQEKEITALRKALAACQESNDEYRNQLENLNDPNAQ